MANYHSRVRILLLFAVSMAAFRGLAREYTINALGPSPRISTEISTNIPFNVVRNDTRKLVMRMLLDGSVSNNVQVAFGVDSDSDGNLSPEESDLVLGWRGGRYFIEDVAADERHYSDAVPTSRMRHLQMIVENDSLFNPRRVAFSSESGRCFEGITPGTFLFKREWNLLKVTRRGGVAASERCKIVSEYSRFFILCK